MSSHDDAAAHVMGQAVADMVIAMSVDLDVSSKLMCASVMTKLLRKIYDHEGIEESRELLAIMSKVLESCHSNNKKKATETTREIIERIIK